MLACAVVGASLGVMGAQCQPPKPPAPAPAAPPAGLSISPGGHDFGNEAADGGSGNSFLFNVTNTGSATTGPLDSTTTGGDANQFEATHPSVPGGPGGPCQNAVLAPGESCFQQVFFLPTKAGPASSTLLVTGDPGGSATANLTGNGTALIATPGSGVSFANETADGVSTNTAVFTVTNNGPVSTSLVVGLQGGDPSQFDLVRPSPPGDCVYLARLGPGASCPQTVLFNPTKVGHVTTTVVVTGDPGGTTTYGLNGTGV